MLSREQVGWQETHFNAAVTAGTPVLAISCNGQYCINIHRVRGSSTQNIILKSGTSSGTAVAIDMPVITASDIIDIPGLQLSLPQGYNLYVDVASSNTPDINIQFSNTRLAPQSF